MRLREAPKNNQELRVPGCLPPQPGLAGAAPLADLQGVGRAAGQGPGSRAFLRVTHWL